MSGRSSDSEQRKQSKKRNQQRRLQEEEREDTKRTRLFSYRPSVSLSLLQTSGNGLVLLD